jgi:hypothetical protein
MWPHPCAAAGGAESGNLTDSSLPLVLAAAGIGAIADNSRIRRAYARFFDLWTYGLSPPPQSPTEPPAHGRGTGPPAGAVELVFLHEFTFENRAADWGEAEE